MVAAGATLTDTPLATGPTPWSMLPVPPEKAAVRVVELPALIVAAPAVKLVITGAATTVTVICAVTNVPAPLVTVSV